MVVDAPDEVETAQKRFDEQYITTSEIAHECGVSRVSVMRARERNLLPNAISCGNTFIWERTAVRPNIDAWKIILQTRRGETA